MASSVVRRGHGVIIIDTEGKFSAERFRDIVVSSGGTARGGETEALLGRVRVIRADSSKELVRVLRHLEHQIIEHDARLLVLDSIVHVLRDFAKSQMPRRQAFLGKIASILKWIAITFEIPVIVTNHGTTTSASDMRPALGNTWSHCVNTRLLMQESNDSGSASSASRTLTIAKSPVAATLSVHYRIGHCGVVPAVFSPRGVHRK